MREEEATRDHELGLVDFDAAADPLEQDGRLSLGEVWPAVFNALVAKDPPADIVVLDDRRLEELPSRWPPTRGWMKERSLAKWNAAVDRLGVPAWNTKASLRSGSGIADTFSIDEHPLYLGRNGVLYSGPAGPTPNGTHAEWKASYRSADDVPGMWSAQWMPYGPYYPRQEVADAFASLAAIHSLSPTI
jgi:hypothetical protein